MSAEEFWRDDPQLFVSYRTFYLNKKQEEMEEIDYKCWLQGLYIHNGNGTLVQSLKQLLVNMFTKKKDNEKIKTYPEKPYSQLEKEKREKTEKEREEQLKKEKYDKFQSTLAYQGSLKRRYLESIKNKNKLNE